LGPPDDRGGGGGVDRGGGGGAGGGGGGEQAGGVPPQGAGPWGGAVAPGANLGVVNGPISGVIVLDVDGRKAANTLQRLGSLPQTWRRFNRGCEISGSSTLAVGRQKFHAEVAGLDLRGGGRIRGFPPFAHRIGRDYRWLVAPEDAALASRRLLSSN